MSQLFDAVSNYGPNGKIKDLLLRVFHAKWPTDCTEDKILEFVISWPIFIRYLSIFCKYKVVGIHGSNAS